MLLQRVEGLLPLVEREIGPAGHETCMGRGTTPIWVDDNVRDPCQSCSRCGCYSHGRGRRPFMEATSQGAALHERDSPKKEYMGVSGRSLLPGEWTTLFTIKE